MAPRSNPNEPTAPAAALRLTKPTDTSVSAPFALFGAQEKLPLAPAAPPKLRKQEIQDAIPKHCFERSTARSFMHLAKDLVFVAAFAYAATFIKTAPCWSQYALWPLYWLVQGIQLTGVWVLAHECGHQAFSPSRFVNDTVGWVLHSALLVPYHSWAISHKKHHTNTCSVGHDEVFVPHTRSAFGESIADTPLSAAWEIFVMLGFGWPAYLIANLSGPAKYKGKKNSHFNPDSAIFVDADTAAEYNTKRVEPVRRRQIMVSDWGFFLTLAVMAYASYTWGVKTMASYYFVPYLGVNLWLVLITYLQHTDTYIPHHRESASKSPEEAWLRGALATVDRSFGWVIDHVFHHIADTHVAHHLFHEMPFYHAREATVALAAKLGPHYLRDATPIPAALWRAWRQCKYIDDEGDVVYYKNAAGLEGKKAQ